MDFDDEDADIAEAIRLSLAESQLRSNTNAGVASTSSSSSVPARRSSPQVIDLTDDFEPVKVESSAGKADAEHRSMMDVFSSTSNDNGDEDEDLKRALALSLAEASLSEYEKPVSTTAAILDRLSRAEMERERQERIKRKAILENTSSATSDVTPHINVKTKRSRPTGQKSPTATATSTSALEGASLPLSPSTSTSAPRPRPQALSSLPTSTRSPASSVFATSSSSSEPTIKQLRTPSFATPTSAEPSHPASSSAAIGAVAQYPPQYTVATFRNTGIGGKDLGRWEIRFEDLVRKEYLVKAMLTTFVLDETWLRQYLPSTIPQCIAMHWSRDNDERAGFLVDDKVTYMHPPLNGFGSFHSKLMLLFYPTFCRVVISSANLVSHEWLQLVNTVYVQDFSYLPVPVKVPEDHGEFGFALHNFLKVMTLPDKILKAINCVDFSPAKTGSLGKLTLKFLGEFSRASRGLAARARFKVAIEERLPPIKVVFPTEQHVQESRLGEMGAGSICFQDQYWDDPTFPRRVMHDFECVGALRGSLMHSKIVLAKTIPMSSTTGRQTTAPESRSTETRCAGWFYVGSANFTESAWGTISNKKATHTSDSGLYVSTRNWELGVVYVIETEEEMQAMTKLAKANGSDVAIDGSVQTFFGPLPVPFRRPLTSYAPNDRPWVR
ncbi:hypothetical protein BGZ65_004270 [Modicella reniformis]|uniref:Uncharacterized protein n=1 Tax=Modicella reniformis TaxID=1440133 RepID=A0A9P6LSK2_9FUNG|nr:hypothetical protein BGZ65_004270 [Modicella reniformis]